MSSYDSRGIAHRLIELLPRRSSPTAPLMEKTHGIPLMTVSPTAKILICAVLVGIALIGAASCEPASGAAPRTTEPTETVLHPAHGYLEVYLSQI